jgi:hypothetical protein
MNRTGQPSFWGIVSELRSCGLGSNPTKVIFEIEILFNFMAMVHFNANKTYILE